MGCLRMDCIRMSCIRIVDIQMTLLRMSAHMSLHADSSSLLVVQRDPHERPGLFYACVGSWINMYACACCGLV